MCPILLTIYLFFFNNPATTEIYTLSLHDALPILRLQRLPPGSVVKIVNENGIGIAHSANGLDWIGRDLSKVEAIARHIAAKEISEIVRWSDDVERITGSATAEKAPWLVSVGFPTDVALAAVLWRFGWGALFSTATLMIAFAIA